MCEVVIPLLGGRIFAGKRAVVE